MCNPNDTINYTEDGLYNYFTTLDTVGGGNGMGIYDVDKDVLIKGLDPLPEIDYNGRFLFHCRRATHGNVAHYNCQPFVGDRYAVVHNGIFSQRDDLCRFYGFDPEKYSDSYLIFKMIQDKGIVNFWNGFHDDSYGVVVVYDKKYDSFYLIKSSGSFDMGEFKSGKTMYASSQISFWKDCKDLSFGKGMWKLTGRGPIRLHKPKEKNTYYYSNYYKTKYKNQYAVYSVGDDNDNDKLDKFFSKSINNAEKSPYKDKYRSIVDLCENAPDELWGNLSEDQDIGVFIESED